MITIFYFFLFILTLLASIGLSYLFDCAVRCILRPSGKKPSTVTVIPVTDDRDLFELYAEYFSRYGTDAGAIILDCGMNDGQRQTAKLISDEKTGVFYCNGDELYSLICTLQSAFTGIDEAKKTK